MSEEWKNKLYFGDNVDMMRAEIVDSSVDLIYLDPPFNSNATYNVLFQEKSGEKSAAQITAFDDTWSWGTESRDAFREVVTTGPKKLADLLEALRSFLGTNDMMAYLSMMARCMVQLHRVLKPTGSLYLHCDPTASHYLKLLLDAVFSPVNFRNEVVWKRVTSHSDAKRWSPVADVLFYYGKSDRVTWNPQYAAHSQSYLNSKYRFKEPDGRVYRLDNMTSPNPRPNLTYEWMGFPPPPKGWRYSRETMAKLHEEDRIWYPEDKNKRPQLKRYLNEQSGVLLGTVWTDIDPINSQAVERIGYPTQKPASLLERILRASSNEGDLILDPFCGCGTAVVVAERLHRRWIGIDITHLAIMLMRHRLHDSFGPELAPYEVLGDPKDVASAAALAAEQPEGRYKFQWWALGLVDARPAQDERKKGADAGIDGHIYFFDDDSGRAKKIIISVKSGHVNVSQIRDLNWVREREKADLAVFITLEEPTRNMLVEAAEGGEYESSYFPGRRTPRVQILTIAQLLTPGGSRIQYPPMSLPATFKKAERQSKGTGQPSMFDLPAGLPTRTDLLTNAADDQEPIPELESTGDEPLVRAPAPRKRQRARV